MLSEEEGAGGVPDASLESPEDHALRKDVQAEIQRGLRQLPDDQRVVVILSDVHGLSYEEIAAVTKAELGTVKSRLSRGRAHLRDYLRQRELLPSTMRL
jgi:RNA polymerase sigma-70 factor (ECF subfamily)